MSHDDDLTPLSDRAELRFQLAQAAQAERTRIVARLAEMAGIVGEDEIARTAHTLMAAAAVIDAERPS